ncbi:cleavage and polyadenylation specificity factor subunit 2-like [Rhopilema esculentum]|uniref:cleavage and polyadenylation specificity factor subunit 2-like n=1 Tax=Rhopilema esculentum TaxID=499914 RepID=UPI0031D44E14|eukprot:gene14198-5205_t
MTSIIRFTALSGAQDESPLCYLLQVDEFRFLLDCGWNELLSMDSIENIKWHIGQIDAVLLSQPDLYHLGAIPYVFGKCGLNCPIYATIPVYKMGQMFLYDFFQSHQNEEDFELFSLDDVDTAFEKIIQLKYSQHVSLKGRGHGLSITPYAAGHMIGGTMWKIMKEGEEDIIYAVDYNHKKEIHLNGAVLETLSRPSLLITDSFTALNIQARRKERDIQLMDNIHTAVRRNGNVLLAVDTAGRVLELAQLLDQLWRTQESGLFAYSLCLLNNVSYNVVEFAKSQVEWMSDRMMKTFEAGRNNPFQFKHITLCHSLADVNKVSSPKVVLASTADLNCGFARSLFIQWADSANNSIIFTSLTPPGTLARKLIDNPNLESIEIQIKTRMKLEGEELEKYLEAEREKAKLEKIQEKLKAERRASQYKEESDSESEEEDTQNNINMGMKSKYDLMLSDDKLRAKGNFFKQAKTFPMFPFKEERLKWDDYGEIIKPEDYFLIQDSTPMEEDTAVQDEEEDEKTSVPIKDLSKIPTKCVITKEKIEIRCQIKYIDFEGRSDGESIKRILSLVKPRQLILVHGTEKATEHLLEYCKKNLGMTSGTVFAPRIGETIDATRESHIYQVKLKDSLVSSLSFAQTREAELAWVDGRLVIERSKIDARSDEKMETDDDHRRDVVPVLEQLPSEEVPGHRSVFVDEPRLSDFKQVLTKAGFQAEFAGGVLVCNNIIAVRRSEAGKIGLSGALCEDYYLIRDLLYQQYAIV